MMLATMQRKIIRASLPETLIDAMLVAAQVGMADPDMLEMAVVCGVMLFG